MEDTDLADGDSPHGCRLSEIYDEALPEVYSYLRARCGSTALAEELTSATFMQAALAWSKDEAPDISIGWLITVARNKLIDYWRRLAVAERSLELLEGGAVQATDPWNAVLDQARASEVLSELAPHYQSALVLRYFDDLSVRECADLLGRTEHSTESLLVRARTAFRNTYEQTGGSHD